MSGCIETAIRYIGETIDEEVLELAVREKNPVLNRTFTLAEKIRTQVILGIVIKDVEILSAITRKIPLRKCNITKFSNYNRDYLIEIPSKLISGKKIIDSIAITYPGLCGSTVGSSNPAISAMSGMIDAYTDAPTIDVDRLEPIGDNVVILTPNEALNDVASGILECTLTSNSDMGHISPRSYRTFSKLCALAMKRYIYNKVYVKLDEGYIKGGHNISRVKDIVDGYSGAIEEYDEAVTNWEKIERLNNKKFNSEFIGLQLGN